MKIHFYQTSAGNSPVEKFIGRLSKMDQADFAEVFDGIEEYGLDFNEAEFRHLKGKLWEIKFKAESGGYRIAYVMISQETMVWLHAFKKDSQKTNREELELAEKRMKEVLS
jgi:phage-related protein